MEPRRPIYRGIVLALLVLLGLLNGMACDAQNIAIPGAPMPGQPAEESEGQAPGQNIFTPADRTSLLWLSDARQLLQQQRYAEAVRLLGAILEAPEDFFFQPDRGSSVHRSLKAEAQRLLGEMPRQGRELYELQYGARARSLLTKAAKAGDASGLAEVSRRFFHTRAGYEATLLLGLHYLDHASPLAGALTLQRLAGSSPDSDQFEPTLSLATATCWIRAGMPDVARRVLEQLRRDHPDAKVEVAGKQLPLFTEQSDGLEWLVALVGSRPDADAARSEQWAMFRGDAARNASAFGSGPLLSMRWQVPTYHTPYVEAMLDQISQNHHQRETEYQFLPSLHPLVVENVVLMRTARNLLAVDFPTGKRIWEVPAEDPFEETAESPSDGSIRQTQEMEAPLGLEARMWSDATYGTLSSDGQLVFAVEDLDLNFTNAASRHLIVNGRRFVGSSGPKPYNRLAAYDIRSGKLQWHIGGSQAEFNLPEAGTFFLGPPLPLMDELYVLGEAKDGIRLIALSAKTGKSLWSQQLAVVDMDILNDPLRRMSGASPSYADGVLVCPTANQSVVAVELATRSLLWGYTYQEEQSVNQRQMMFFGMHSVMNATTGGRWSDATATIVDGRVLVTPPDSNQIHCLSLINGKLLWKQPRQDDLYLACAFDGKAVLVGRSQVRALKLEDGQAAWNGKAVSLPPGGSPSGWGFRGSDRYYVPLSSAEVLAVDLNSGKAAHRFKARGGTVPGNLVCYRGHIVSQRADAIEAFYQLDALREQVDRRLAGNPDDAEALSLRGEILWDDGKLADAVAAFRRSLELVPDPRTRDLLRESLFDGLRTHFADYRTREEEIRGLIEQPEHRATYLRLMATGCEKAGEPTEAIGYYATLIDLDKQHPGLETIEADLLVRRDRWVQIQLAALRRKAGPDIQARVDQLAQSHGKAALAAGGPEDLRRVLNYFGGQPVAEEARRRLLERLIKNNRLLEVELLLAEQQRSSDAATAGAAVAELAALLREQGFASDAAECYRTLQGRFADVVCRDGKTGRQLVASFPPGDPVAKHLDAAGPWPVGKVEVETSAQAGAPPISYNRSVLDYLGRPAPFFSDLDIELHQNPPMLVARDGLGNARWQMPLDAGDQGRFAMSAAFMRVAVQGHLLVVSMGHKIMAIDTLVRSADGAPKLLWSHDLDTAGAPEAPLPIQAQVIRIGGGFQQWQFARSAENPITIPEVVSDQLLCYQEYRDLVAVEPATGERLWVRHDIDPGSTVFGDHEYVFVVPQGESTAMVLRAADGAMLVKRSVPPQHQATIGRSVLVVVDLPDQRVLQMVDAWESREVWPARKFAPETRVCVVDNEVAGVLEPSGHFTLIDLADGTALVDAKLPPQESVSEIHVFRSPEQYILVTNSTANQAANVRTHALHPVASARIVRGLVWGFDRKGELLWSEPVVVEDQHLPLSQPGRLPVLAFACMVQERRPNAPTQTKTAVLFIDKRTGWKHTAEFDSPTSSFQLVGNPEKKTVEMQLQRNTVTLRFTDRPLDPKGDGSAKKNSGAASAAFKAIRKAAEKALEGSLHFALPALDTDELLEKLTAGTSGP
ncbi:MAG: PQQ-binding-like beta-propeller repeat protein [Pirellulales bacterium]|nr:PQQ-binding-like beta-propeller repeat protein [Pirellulales bacterium]